MLNAKDQQAYVADEIISEYIGSENTSNNFNFHKMQHSSTDPASK